MTTLLDLPDELLLHVALLCDDVADVSRLARTCTALHELITRTEHFWSLMLARHFNVRSDGAGAHDDRDEFRARCVRMRWTLPAGAADALSVSDDEPNVVRVHHPAMCTAFAAQPLAARGLSAFCLTVRMPTASPHFIGLVAVEQDDVWTDDEPPDGRVRALVHDARRRGQFLHPVCADAEARVHAVHACRPVFAPAGWPGGGRHGWASEQPITMVVDADRGRVYYSVGGSGVYLIAFDDVRLAQLGNLRPLVTLACVGAWARIERVRVTDAMRAALRAVDVEYAEAQRAGK